MDILTQEKEKLRRRLAKNKKDSIFARDSPRHLNSNSFTNKNMYSRDGFFFGRGDKNSVLI